MPSQSLLADLFAGPDTEHVTARSVGKGKAIYLNHVDILNYNRDRLLGKEKEVYELVRRVLKESGVKPAFAVTDPKGEPLVGVETHVFRNGGVTIVGLLTNPELRVGDLGPPEVLSNRRFEKPQTVVLTLPGEFYVYDIRAAKALGSRKQLTVQLDPYEPRIFSVSPVAVPALTLYAPARLARGKTGQIGLSFSGASPAAVHVFHVDVVDPSGKIVPFYSGNVLAPYGRSEKILPLAVNDNIGKWEIRVHDVLSGQTQVTSVEVD